MDFQNIINLLGKKKDDGSPDYSDPNDYPADTRIPQNLNVSGKNVINGAKQAASDLSMGILNSQKPPGEFEPGGGGITSITSPVDLAAPLAGKALSAVGSEAISAAPRLLGNEVGSVGPGTADLIDQKAASAPVAQAAQQEAPSLADQIRAAAARNPIKQTELPTDVGNAYYKSLRDKVQNGQIPNYFDKVRDASIMKNSQDRFDAINKILGK